MLSEIFLTIETLMQDRTKHYSAYGKSIYLKPKINLKLTLCTRVIHLEAPIV